MICDKKREVLEEIAKMEKEIVQLTSDMVRIPSVNPSYSGVNRDEVLGGEKKVQKFLKPIFDSLCESVDVWEIEKERPNMVGTIKGTGGGRSLIYNGHIDVVPTGPKEDWIFNDPFSGKVDKGKLWGRGSCDMKGGIASQIMACEALKRAGIQLKGDLLLETVVGEEVMEHEKGITATVERGYTADAAIISEPSGPPKSLAIIPVSPGLLWMKVTVSGKSTHASVRREFVRAGGKYGEIGMNAVDKGVFIIESLKQLESEWGFTKKHPLFEPGHFVLHPGIIDGRPHEIDVPFVVSDYCTIQYAVWYHPDENVEEVKKEITEHIMRAAQSDLWLRNNPPTVEWLLHWPPYNVSADHPITEVTARAHQEANNDKALIHGFAAVCDAAFLNIKGIPAISYGPGSILVAHSTNEYVEVEELIKATRTFALTAMDWCGTE